MSMVVPEFAGRSIKRGMMSTAVSRQWEEGIASNASRKCCKTRPTRSARTADAEGYLEGLAMPVIQRDHLQSLVGEECRRKLQEMTEKRRTGEREAPTANDAAAMSLASCLLLRY